MVRRLAADPIRWAGALPGTKFQLLSLNHMSLKLKVHDFGYLILKFPVKHPGRVVK